MSGDSNSNSAGNKIDNELGPVYLHSIVVSLISSVLFLSKLNSLVVLILIVCIIMSTKLTEYLLRTKKVVIGSTIKKFVDNKIDEGLTFFANQVTGKAFGQPTA